jgi:hypothetical protein
MGHLDFAALSERFSRVRVSVELREMAARKVDPDAVAF